MSQDEIAQLWSFLPQGYLFTIAVETLVLWFALSPPRTRRDRLLAGVFLTAFTYPIVVLVLPIWFADQPRWQYLLVAEIFAPVAECALFYIAWKPTAVVTRANWLRDLAAIIVANLASFGCGEIGYFWNPPA